MNRFNSYCCTAAASLAFLLFVSTSAMAMAGSPPIVLPEGVLTAAQIDSALSGKTVAALREDKQQEFYFFFGSDYQVTRVRDGWQRSGRWNVRDDGRLCVDFKDTGRDCRILVKEGEVLRQYAVKKDGNHRYEITYSDFRQGNQLAKMSKVPVLPEGTLKKKQVRELFSGQTVESVTARKNRVSQTYYSPDGRLEQLRNGVKRYGQWRVNKNSRMCLQMDGLEEKCRIIVKEDGHVKKYIVKKNGQHQHSVSYRNFTPGKAFK
jgi:hypothetical protein